jgi:uncharacterized protein YcgI (DUF1989 family)
MGATLLGSMDMLPVRGYDLRARGCRMGADDTLIVVPAREARAVEVAAGEVFRVIDLEGGQVVDLFAFNAHDVEEHASASHTRVAIDRLFPRPGEAFFTNLRRPILTLVHDRSPGVHDMLCAACDPARYRALGVNGPHASCAENLQTAMASLGHRRAPTPQPINLFMDVRVEPDGSLVWGAAPTAAGDHVVLRADMDAIVVASACPQDLNAINHGTPTSVAIERLV